MYRATTIPSNNKHTEWVLTDKWRGSTSKWMWLEGGMPFRHPASMLRIHAYVPWEKNGSEQWYGHSLLCRCGSEWRLFGYAAKYTSKNDMLLFLTLLPSFHFRAYGQSGDRRHLVILLVQYLSVSRTPVWDTNSIWTHRKKPHQQLAYWQLRLATIFRYAVQASSQG